MSQPADPPETAPPQSLLQWLNLCSQNRDMLAEYDRLRDTNLQRTGSPLTVAIDDATGKYASDARAFFDFCLDPYHDRITQHHRRGF